MKYFCFLLLVVFLTSCKNDASRTSDLMTWVPDDTSVLVKTTSIESLKSLFNNNQLLLQFSDHSSLKPFQSKLDVLSHLKPLDDVLIAFGTTTDSLQLSVITKYHADIFNLDSLPNHLRETINVDGNSMVKTTIDHQVIYSMVKDSIFFASNDRQLAESAFTPSNKDSFPVMLSPSTTNDNAASVLINTTAKPILPKFHFDKNLGKIKFSNYYSLDAKITQDQLKFDGITIARDSSKSLINTFRNTLPQTNQLPKICPPDVDGFLSFTFHDFKIFQKNLQKFKPTDSLPLSPYFDSVMEAGVIYKNDNAAVFLYSIDPETVMTNLGQQNSTETYRDISIYDSAEPQLFSKIFSPFISEKETTYFININDFFVFSSDMTLLKDIIASYQNDATLYNAAAFEDMMINLSDASSLLIYANSNRLKDILTSSFDTKQPIETEGFNASAIQFVYENDYAHVHAVIDKAQKTAPPNSVQESANVTLGAEILTDPQFVNNHTNDQKEVVVQDIHNNLYLISKDGNILWKKALDDKILGRIEQIDVYKNGRLQLAFATQHRVYVLDRAGKDVDRFPLKFKDPITQPLSVFDYDNTRNYRLLVTQGSALLMYDKHGKTVSGFTYKNAENTINTQPQHFRIGRKDYIVFVQGKELEILSRVGKTRVNVKNNIDFGNSGVYIYDNKFTTTTVNGDLVQIDQNGKLSSSRLNLGKKHNIAATNKTLVTLSENILHIKTNKIELDYGEYTTPQIFYVNDKIYVSVTDLQAKKVYLFDSMGKSIPNFPVYGNSAIDLDNIDKGKHPEIVTKGGSHGLIIYQIN